MKREIREETGLIVEVGKLLYICDVGASSNTVLHIIFAIERKGGVITLPTNEYDDNPIHDVRFIPKSVPPAGLVVLTLVSSGPRLFCRIKNMRM